MVCGDKQYFSSPLYQTKFYKAIIYKMPMQVLYQEQQENKKKTVQFVPGTKGQ